MHSYYQLVFAGSLAIFASATSANAAKQAAPAPRAPQFDWETVPPSRELQFHDCYDAFKCARLEVPLDWLNDSDTRTATIAIKKLPAVVSDDDHTFGGSIFTNPGGPGGSGVRFIQVEGHNLQRYVDKPGRRHYEIVSWDPRGVGYSTPVSDCFRSNIIARDAYLFEYRGNGGLEQGDSTINHARAMVKGLAQRCESVEEQEGAGMAYVNTPSVARDMVEMVDKIDELRRREAAERTGGEPRIELKRRNGEEDRNVPRLQYIGFSYGTVLGNYFASLFPGRVGRMVLDGVFNTEDYANGPGWLANLVDTDEMFDKFFDGCHKAGPSSCALAIESDSSASEIKSRFWSWVVGLDEAPQPVLSPSGSTIIITGNDIRGIVVGALCLPIKAFKPMAETFHQAMAGNASNLVAIMEGSRIIPRLQDACPVGNATAPPSILVEAQSAVLCGDGDDISDKDNAWWHKYIDHQVNISKIFGAYWTNLRFTCSSWPFRPNWSFKGPFRTPKPDPNLVAGRPAAPLLFLSNRLDPVTPLRAARAMAANHPDAAVIIQEAMGHCAVGTAPSQCTKKIVADYFETGEVPSEETACEASCGPWADDCNVYESSAGFGGGSRGWSWGWGGTASWY
ncbi:hypothetical protein G7Z17_g3045 [Cylindrodendrum hubeiense]|uniref:Peptidase S33 tripeptidyl aminopeptidase-like C-terminal domain-containing protein n=1 Tax=Cylindrodendrum hubeiense TaxID=595255 RepID=A0A9P5LIH9_9HYPO|nr:hypothetical protein G7Z17_g3045 [Cylindrodendrum hubeiense]